MAAAATTYKKVSTSHIPDDIDFSILSKLPLKSLKRFTCVQKSWSLLFQNPNFVNMFRTNFFISKHEDDDKNTRILLKVSNREFSYHESLCVLFGDNFKDRVRLDWPPVFEEDNIDGIIGVRILGSTSVNGFLCLYQDIDYNTTKTVLWNPVTEAFKTIPPSRQPYENIEFNSHPHAFGYDRINDDYKVIREVHYPMDFEGNWIYLPNKDHPFWEEDVHELDVYDDYWEEAELIIEIDDPFWEIYSLKSNSWRKLVGVDMSTSFSGKSHVSLNELSHWLSRRNDMVSFDFSNETFFTTALPSDSCIKEDLVVLNGSLSLISNYVYDKKKYFNIWILGELGIKESWTKLFVVGPFTRITNPIGAGMERLIFFTNINDDLAWFDCSTGRIVEIGVTGDLRCC